MTIWVVRPTLTGAGSEDGAAARRQLHTRIPHPRLELRPSIILLVSLRFGEQPSRVYECSAALVPRAASTKVVYSFK
jgi:hypothetical protein